MVGKWLLSLLKPTLTIQEYLDNLLESVPDGEWITVEITMKKKNGDLYLAQGETFGPFVVTPKIIPDECPDKVEPMPPIH